MAEIQLEKMLLSKNEAARVLSISEKKLWCLTRPRGPIQAVRLGGRILYSPETLKAFIREKMAFFNSEGVTDDSSDGASGRRS